MKYDAGLQVLAAGTLGHGVYTINTSAFSFISDQIVNENKPSSVVPFTVNNPVGTAYTLSATSDNPLLVKSSSIVLGGASPASNRTLKFTPVLNANTPANGVANITVTISAGGFTYRQTFRVTVNFVNHLPTLTSIPTQVTQKNEPSQAINFTIGDVETAATAIKVTATSSNPMLIRNIAADLALSGSGPVRTGSRSGRQRRHHPFRDRCESRRHQPDL